MNAQEYSEYLKNVSALPQVEAYKRQTYEFLNIREGGKYLDVGCGLGTDVISIAEQAGIAGEVVGLDSSEERLKEARRQAIVCEVMGKPPVEFDCGDAHCLPYPDNYFDGVRADRTFQHLENPERSLAEMARVAKIGGRVVVSEPDWRTLTIDPFNPLTRRVLAVLPRCARNWRVGSELRNMFVSAGLTGVEETLRTDSVHGFDKAREIFRFDHLVNQAIDQGILLPMQADAWIRDIQQHPSCGASLTMFIVCGTKP